MLIYEAYQLLYYPSFLEKSQLRCDKSINNMDEEKARKVFVIDGFKQTKLDKN